MSRIAPVQQPSERSQQLLDGVQAKLGMTPNMMSTMAHSAATLDAYLKFSDALSKGELRGQAREQIALTVGQANECHYCLSAHSAIGKMLGLTAEQIREARLARANDSKVDAILKLSNRIVEARGNLADEDIDAAEKAVVAYGGVQMGQLEQNVSWISLFIALAPMLGFMGTVIGVIGAFDAIAAAGDISPAVVADGIKVALLTTVFGLIKRGW